MTEEREAVLDAADDTAADESGGDDVSPAEVPAAARLHFAVAASFAAAGLAGLVVAFLQLLWPDVASGIGILSFGRLWPMALNALVIGFGAFGAVGAAYAVVARVGERPLAMPAASGIGLAIGAAGLVAGIVAVGLGQSTGVPFFELPIWADAALAVSLFNAAVVVVATIRDGPATARPAVWFSVAGVVVMALAFLVALVPGISGVNGALQAAFSFQALVGVGMVASALGAAYAVAGDWMERGHEGTRVAQIAFWSFVFIAPWVAPRFLALGPIPDWLETIGVVFGFVLLIPVVAVLADLAPVVRSATSAASVFRPLMTGAAFFTVYAVFSLVPGLRSPSAVTNFTAWSQVFWLAVVLGIVGSFVVALAHHLTPGWRPRLASAQWWLATGGVVLAVVGLIGAGLQQGLVFVSNAGAESPVAFGDGFRQAATTLDVWYALVVVGLADAMAGAVLFAAQAWRAVRGGPAPAEALDQGTPEEPVPAEAPGDDGDADEADTAAPARDGSDEPAPPLAPRRLVQGVVALFALAAVSVFVLPALESANNTASLRGEARDFESGSVEAAGRDLYVSEGCVYCHTQQVRPIVTDVGLGPVSQPGDYAGDTPALLGEWRVGPDLFAAGSRPPTDSVRWVVDHLRNPRQAFDGGPGRPWSSMPAYDYLSDQELLALASYIVALR